MADGFMPEYWPANRIIGKLEKALVKAENILGLIQSEQIANLAAGKITGLITSEQIKEIEAAKVSGKLTSEQIESIKASQISGKLTNAQIESIEAAKITGVITETQIGPEAVTTPKLKAGAITTAKLAAGSVTAEILAAGSVTTEKLVAGSVNAGALAAGSVTTAKLAAEAITAEKIGAGQILTTKLAAGAVTAEKLSVTTLSAISANLGTVTAGKIEGVEIKALKVFELNESGENAAEANTLRWVEGATVREEITGWREGIAGEAKRRITIRTRASGVKPTAGVNAFIQIVGRDGFAPEGSAEVNVVAGVQEKLIINENGQSSFLQLIGTAKRIINFGTVELEWNGSSQFTVEKKVEHKLGVTPIVVVGNNPAVTQAGYVMTRTYTSTQFTVFVGTPNSVSPPAGTKTTVTWIAIG